MGVHAMLLKSIVIRTIGKTTTAIMTGQNTKSCVIKHNAIQKLLSLKVTAI